MGFSILVLILYLIYFQVYCKMRYKNVLFVNLCRHLHITNSKICNDFVFLEF